MGDRPWSACFARITLQFFCANSSKSGRPTGPLNFFFFNGRNRIQAEVELNRGCKDGCGLLDCGWDLMRFPNRFTFLFQIQAFLLTFLSEDPNILSPFHGLSEKQRNHIRGLPKKFVSRACGISSSLQFFRIPALAVDLFRSAAKLV